jgi:hypothetical protein
MLPCFTLCAFRCLCYLVIIPGRHFTSLSLYNSSLLDRLKKIIANLRLGTAALAGVGSQVVVVISVYPEISLHPPLSHDSFTTPV